MLYPNGEFTLGLSLSVKPHKPPQASLIRERGNKPQTTYSKRMVRNCVARLEQQHGKINLAFATYTLPDLDEVAMSRLRENWGEVSRQLMQALGRDLEAAGIRPDLVYVNEIQQQRYKESGVIAPHIHAVFQSRRHRYAKYAITKERNTEIWNRVISNVLGQRTEAPSGASIAQVKKSAERYMSKYMSKGSEIAQEVQSDGMNSQLPKSWWGASYTLRRWVKDHIKLFADSSKDYIKNNYRRFQENIQNSPFSWLYVHNIVSTEPHGENVEIPVAIVGRVKPEYFNSFEYKQLEDIPMAWNS